MVESAKIRLMEEILHHPEWLKPFKSARTVGAKGRVFPQALTQVSLIWSDIWYDMWYDMWYDDMI